MKVIEGNLVLKEDTTFNEDLKVEGDVRCEGGHWDLNCRNLDCWNLTCRDLNCWNLTCRDLNCWNLNCRNLDCRNLNCWDLNCENLDCWDLNCENLDCWDLNFYAAAIAYNSFKCKSWKAGREKYIIKCLDGEIEIKDKKKICDKCGQEIGGVGA